MSSTSNVDFQVACDEEYARRIQHELDAEAAREAVEEVPVQAGPSRRFTSATNFHEDAFGDDIQLRFRFPDNSTVLQGFKSSATFCAVYSFAAYKLDKKPDKIQLVKYPKTKLEMSKDPISSAGLGKCCLITVIFK